MSDNNITSNVSLPDALSTYEVEVGSIAETLSKVLPYGIEVSADEYTILSNLLIKDSKIYGRLKSIVGNEHINEKHLEMCLNASLADIQNEYQALAFFKRVERMHKTWFSYINDIKDLMTVSGKLEFELEIIASNYGDSIFSETYESIQYTIPFALKFFRLYDVLNTYFWLLTDKSVANQEAGLSSRSTLTKPIKSNKTLKSKGRILINSDAMLDLYNILKQYMNVTDHEHLLHLLKEGSNDSKLLFNTSGNKLADLFRKLYDAQIITGCDKKELQNWIISHFQYTDTRKKLVKDFTYGYLESFISGNQINCKNPIITIKNSDGRRIIELQHFGSSIK